MARLTSPLADHKLAPDAIVFDRDIIGADVDQILNASLVCLLELYILKCVPLTIEPERVPNRLRNLDQGGIPCAAQGDISLGDRDGRAQYIRPGANFNCIPRAGCVDRGLDVRGTPIRPTRVYAISGCRLDYALK